VTEVFLNLTEILLNLTEVYLTLTEVHLTLTDVFPCFFLSCKANARAKLAKTVHGPQSTTLVCICVVRMLLFVLFGCYFCCSMYCLCVNVYCHWVTTQLKLINKYT
jgi:cobalamin synthase